MKKKCECCETDCTIVVVSGQLGEGDVFAILGQGGFCK